MDGALAAASAAIRQHLARGAPWDACDEFRAVQARATADAALLYWGALAHARAGAPGAAHLLLDQAEAAGADKVAALFEQVLSLRGRLLKDGLAHIADPARAGELAARAFDAYHAAYLIRGDAFPGVNAASMALLAGQPQRARGLAAEVAARLALRPAPHDAWHHATLAEAALLRGDIEAAREAYHAAWAAAGDDVGAVSRMRAQLQLLAPVLAAAAGLLATVPAPAVIAFAGHMIDRPDRATPRFAPALEAPVAQALRQRLGALRRPIVYTSAACGGDLLLAEAALAQGAELNLVLPFDREDFVRTSVATGGAQWVPRFERVLREARRVIMATEEAYLGDDVLFEHAARLVEGLAVARAGQLATEPMLLALLAGAGDESPAGGDPLARVQPGRVAIGGTAETIGRWRAGGGRSEVIDLDAIAAAAPQKLAESAAMVAVAATAAEARTAAPLHGERSLKTLLFADFAGFGRVRDTHAPLFHARFLDIVAGCIASASAPPIQTNTWGDALYAVFDQARDGAEFAWQLLERMSAVDWKVAGLVSQGQVRIALHAGPVFRRFDPVIGRDNHFGSSVTQAARIEPVTQPGTVYASEAFAATLAAGGAHGFLLEYLGIRALAKGQGEMRLYRLQRPER